MKHTQLDKILNQLSDEDKKKAIENRYAYIFSKAELYLKIGAEKYRANDFFSQPDERSPEMLSFIKKGCEQIIQVKGLSREMAFTDLGVAGFYSLMRLFHFEKVKRETDHEYQLNGQKGVMDKITFEHVMDKSWVTYYNFCKYEHDVDKDLNS
jgi:hypothetical protein